MTTQPHRLVTAYYKGVALPHITLERYTGAAWEPQFSTQDLPWLQRYLKTSRIRIDRAQNVEVKEQ